jgi:hypothetical protein
MEFRLSRRDSHPTGRVAGMLAKRISSMLLAVATIGTLVAIAAPTSLLAHQSGCHAAHSCPSDTGSYVCGDTGNYSQCPGMSGTATVSSYGVAVGKTVTGYVSWAAAPTSATYQWQRDGVPILGATTTSYLVTGDDMGRSLVLTAAGTDGRGQSATASSTAVVVPALTGTATLGQTTATVGTVLTATMAWNATVVETYQWLRAGVPIDGATSATYTVTKGDLGAALALVVTGTVGTASAAASTGAISPQASITLRLTGPAATVRVGTSIVVRGTARSAAGVQGRAIKVKVWRKVGRRWVLVRTATARANATGVFTISHRVPGSGAGAWRAQASVTSSPGIAAASSAMRSFTAS